MRVLIATVLAAAVCPFAAAQAPDLSKMDIVQKSVPDGPVAKVGGHVITRDEFLRFYQNELRRAMIETQKNEVTDLDRARLALRCVGLMLEGQLLFEEGVRRKIAVSADEVEKTWQSKLAQTQKIVLDREKKQLTEAEVLARIEYASRQEVLDDIKHALLTDKMRDTVIKESGITVSDADVHKEFEAGKGTFDQPAGIHLQQIFVNPKNIPGGLSEKDERARKKAQQALDRLAAGQSFEGVARAMSDSPDAKSGGDMGTVALRDCPPFMVEAAAKLKPGEVSGVLKSEYGFHVIKLLSAEVPRAASEKDAAGDIRKGLLVRREADAVHAYCDKLIKKGNYVEVYLELEKNLALNGVPPKAAAK